MAVSTDKKLLLSAGQLGGRCTVRDEVDDNIRQAAEAIGACEALWIGAGAGMGVDSGLPDFRGNEGFWNAYPPFKKLGLSFYDLANPRWFAEKPAQAWGFYGHRYNLYRQTDPHPGFQIILRWAQSRPQGYFVFTSNVDGHFERARFEAERIVEVHGSIHHRQCAAPCGGRIWQATEDRIAVDSASMLATDPLPRCQRCGGTCRPNILMFGDFDWLPQRTEEQVDRYQDWLDQVEGRAVVALEIGAGTAVPTVRYEAQRRQTRLVRINSREASVRGNGISIAMSALAALRQIDECISAQE